MVLSYWFGFSLISSLVYQLKTVQHSAVKLKPAIYLLVFTIMVSLINGDLIIRCSYNKNAMQRKNELYNRCDWTQMPVHCKSFRLQSLENSIVLFHPALTEISRGCALLFFFLSFLPKAIYKHWRRHIFLFFWLMHLALFYNWEVQERHAFCIIPLTWNQQCITCLLFLKIHLFHILNQGESTNECEKSAGFVYFGVLRNDGKLPPWLKSIFQICILWPRLQNPPN